MSQRVSMDADEWVSLWVQMGGWVAFSCKLSLHVISVCDLRTVMFHLVTILMTSFQTAVWTSSYNYTAIVVLLIVFTHKPVVLFSVF